MTRVSVVPPDGGEIALQAPIRLRILEDGSTTEHRLGVAEITIAPHTDGPPQHRHGRHDEGFYVVAGTASFTVGDKSYVAPAGTLPWLDPGRRGQALPARGRGLVILTRCQRFLLWAPVRRVLRSPLRPARWPLPA